MKERLDKFLVDNKFYESRARAQEAIRLGKVVVNGLPAKKASCFVTSNDKIEAERLGYVSRAQQKLERAICDFGIELKGKVVVDVGASTGGFSKCALEAGAKKVFAVDVGSGQLAPELVADSRVVNLERTNFLDLDNKILKEAQFVVADVSFVSLSVLKEKFAVANCDILALVKPQFECGKQYAKKHKGIVSDPKVHEDVLKKVICEFESVGLYAKNITYSPVLGGDGNREFLVLFSKEKASCVQEIKKIVEKAQMLE